MGKALHPGGLIPTHRFEFERDQAGLWTGSQEYHCQQSDLARVLPPRGAPHYLMPFLGVAKVKISGFQQKLIVLNVTYAGFQASYGGADDGGPEPEYTLTLSTSEAPVEVHDRYDTLSAQDIREASELARNPPKSADGKKVLEPDTAAWDPLKLELYDDIKKGLESYREPSVTWVKRWISDSIPSDLNNIGKIEAPEGSPPPVADDRNWMNTGLVSREKGGVYDNELSWELSGRGGWDSRYYA